MKLSSTFIAVLNGLKVRSLFSLVVLASGLCLVSSLQAQRSLAFRFTAGGENKLSVNTTTKIAMKYMGQDVETTMQMDSGISQYIDSVNTDGLAAITQKITSLKLSVAGGPLGVKLTYDSTVADSQDNPLSDVLQPIVGAEFGLSLSRQGEISNFKAPADLLATLAKQPGSRAFGQQFSEAGFRNMVSQGSLKFPEKALNVGDQWKDQVVLTAGEFGETTVTIEYTYQGIFELNGKMLDKIGMKMTTSIKPAKGATGSQLKITEQSSAGFVYFDNAVGRLDHSTLKQTMTTEVIIGQNSIVQTVTTNVTTSMK
ncbi:MAG: hypothetical protein HN617_09640 [Planctomycetaceae bacterium]|jgi:hypothetical protein|nr:hypothetical protein [Planctomycetaceae bacterium]MBT4723351.1 hypothetical protein [Planctomycetaceae bacterium]MBT4845934.1 hypothetical protein [Planctomycetaceae bacterium]MBT5126112.1 hypothetical protein [Planctomycetaceae bacterium]MBT5598070.1 hypothetical protein [Planctomycetaceae bacterium]